MYLKCIIIEYCRRLTNVIVKKIILFFKSCQENVVTGCHGNYDSENKVKVFRLPQNQGERKKWIKNNFQEIIHLINPIMLCEKHFPVDLKIRDNDYETVWIEIKK